MTRLRVAAGAAAIVTAVLLQATLITPLSTELDVSLPAVVVAAIGLCCGPGTGVAFGFCAGLTADLGSTHPAGVLALCWLGAGLIAGLAADRRSLAGDVLYVGVICGMCAAVTTVLLILVHADGAHLSQLPMALPSAVLDGLLAGVVVPLVRGAVRTEALRAPHPVVELSVERAGG
jgi:cell shape-determining protein MreD